MSDLPADAGGAPDPAEPEVANPAHAAWMAQNTTDLGAPEPPAGTPEDAAWLARNTTDLGGEPPLEVQARIAGHSWQAIDDHVGARSVEATQAGYSQPEIDRHLGYADPPSFRDSWYSTAPDIADSLSGDQPQLDLGQSPTLRADYAAALGDYSVKGPLDFAYHYAAGALQAADDVTPEDKSQQTVQAWQQAAVNGAAEMGGMLPNPRDFTDAALSVGGAFDTARQNLIDHWKETGQPPLDAAMQAQSDPSLSDKLTAAPPAPKSPFDDVINGVLASMTGGAGRVGGDDIRSAGQTLLGAGPAAFTAGVRGIGSLMDFGLDPLHVLRTILAPDIQNAVDKLAPAAGQSLGDLIFHATGVPETKPETALGRGALALAEGAVAGAPFGAATALISGASSVAGEAVSEWTHSDRLAAIASLLSAAVFAGVASHGTAAEAQDTARAAFHAQLEALDRLSPTGTPSATEAVLGAVAKVMRRAPVTMIDPEAEPGTPLGTRPAEEAYAPITPAEREPATAEPEGMTPPTERFAQQARKLAGAETTTAEQSDEFSNPNLFANLQAANAARGGEQPRPFVPEATPPEKLEALVRENPEAASSGDNPNMFADLAKNEDPQTQELAASYDTATSVYDYLKKIVTKSLQNDSGAFTPGGDPRVVLRRGAPRDPARDSTETYYKAAGEAEMAIRRAMGDRNKFTQYFGAQLDRMQVYINPHMREYEDAAASGDIERIKGSLVGQLIRYLQGEPGVALPANSKLAAIAKVLRDVNSGVHQYLSQLAAEGKIDPLSYQKDYLRQMWKDPNAADGWFASRQGSGASWKQKTIPTIMEGLEAGLEPVELNPLKLALMDIHGKLGFAMTHEILGEAQKAGWVQYALKPPNVGDVPLVGALAKKGVPGADPPMSMQAYAHPGFARMYNNAFGMGIHQVPFEAIGNVYDAAIRAKNSFLMAKMVLPTYHAATITWSVVGGGLWRGTREIGFGLAHGDVGEIGRGTLDLAMSGTFAPELLRGLYQGARKMGDYVKMANDPVIDRLASVNARFGPRQEIYQTGRAPNYWQAIARNYRDAEGNAGAVASSKALAHAVWDQIGLEVEKEPGMGYVGLRAKMARSGFYEFGRLMTSISAPLFDYGVPFLKAFANYKQLEMEMRFNAKRGTPKSDAWLDNRARQIVDNTDDRMGEMNMDNVYWNRLLKDASQTAAISTGWVYGTWRQGAAALGMRLSGGRSHIPFRTTVERNPPALGNVLGMAATVAIVNTVYQAAMSGNAPGQGEGPFGMLQDLFVGGRTGGTSRGGQPARIQIPGEQKEIFDIGKIVANTYGATQYGGPGAGMLEALGSTADYANFKDAWNSFGFLLNHGVDAIGHRVAYTPGGLPDYVRRLYEPIIASTAENLRTDSGIPKWQTLLGLRESPLWAEDMPAFMGSWESKTNKFTHDELIRARWEERQHGGGAGASLGGYSAPARAPSERAPREYAPRESAPRQRQPRSYGPNEIQPGSAFDHMGGAQRAPQHYGRRRR